MKIVERNPTFAEFSSCVMSIDCFFASFPKSGRTWVLLFLQRYLHNFYGGISMDIQAFYPVKTGHPKVLFIHSMSRYRMGAPTVFIMRDLRDLVVSYYFQMTRRHGEKDIGMSEFIKENISDIIGYYREWDKVLKDCRSMVIHYEDIHRNELFTWCRIIGFLGLKINFKLVKAVAKSCRFDNVKNSLSVFENHPESWRFLAIEGDELTATPKDPESHKFRRGKVGGYVDYLSPEDIEFVELHMDKIPERFRHAT